MNKKAGQPKDLEDGTLMWYCFQPKDLAFKALEWRCHLFRDWVFKDKDKIPPNKLRPTPSKPMAFFREKGVLGVEQGDGRPYSQFPFMFPEEDFRFYQPPRLLDVLNATVSWLYNPNTDNIYAYKQLAYVIYPCDISQFNPHGMRGETLIPYQLAALEVGLQLIKDPNRGVYLPTNWVIEDIPLSF